MTDEQLARILFELREIKRGINDLTAVVKSENDINPTVKAQILKGQDLKICFDRHRKEDNNG